MIGVGEGGFSGIMPCFRRISFLFFGLVVVKVRAARRKEEQPLGISVGVIDRNIDRSVHCELRFGRAFTK